jgi:opacity protein-like surface antigen
MEDLMLRKMLFICLFLFFGLATTVAARPYHGLGVMAVLLEDADLSGGAAGKASFDGGWGAMAFVGSKMELFRVEGELAYRRSSIDTVNAVPLAESRGGRATALSALFNVYLDFGRYDFRPFLGAGAGAARVDATLAGRDDRDTVFAYQGIGGVSLGNGLDLGYRYFATENPRIDDLKAEYKSHTIYLSVRF